MTRSILITGGAGYIGTHILTLLNDPQDIIVVIDNLVCGTRDALEKAEVLANRKLTHFCQGDLADANAMHLLTMLFQRFRFTIVIHLAAHKSIAASYRDPLTYYNNNVVSTLNLVRAMSENNCKRLIFSSSATVYAPQIKNEPCYETSLVSASSCYGRTKVICENILQDVCSADPEWTVLSLRYFNPVGAHPSGKLSQNIAQDSQEGLMAALCTAAAGRTPEFTIFGNSYNSPDGTPVRDFVHIMDLAAGHIAGIERIDISLNGFDTVNLGTGSGTSIQEMLYCMRTVSKKSIPCRVGPQRTGDIGVVYANVEKASTILRWSAVHDITSMCRDAWASYCAQEHKKDSD